MDDSKEPESIAIQDSFLTRKTKFPLCKAPGSPYTHAGTNWRDRSSKTLILRRSLNSFVNSWPSSTMKSCARACVCHRRKDEHPWGRIA